MDIRIVHSEIQSMLKSNIIFWLEHGMDHRYGGVYTCLDREGKIYSTDKSVWMQGRCAWTFCNLCRLYGVKEEWMRAAKSCLDFLEEHCINHDKGNRLYFLVTEDGKPLQQRRFCFSEAFYAMGNAEYYGITGDETYLNRAKYAYELIWLLNNGLIVDPTGLVAKNIPSTRSLRTLADPMIYLNLTSIMRRVDPRNNAMYSERSNNCIDTILRFHRKKELQCTLENVGLQGEFLSEVTTGRIVNPGHDIECSWFMMEEAQYKKDTTLFSEAEGIFWDAVNHGWDKEYEGLFYYVDCLHRPPEAYEHDMKLWWPHNEMLIATLTAFCETHKPEYLVWFDKVFQYCKRVFDDPKYGEWYGYLRRDGKPTMPPCKGSTFKGPFHVARSLMMVDQLLNTLK